MGTRTNRHVILALLLAIWLIAAAVIYTPKLSYASTTVQAPQTAVPETAPTPAPSWLWEPSPTLAPPPIFTTPLPPPAWANPAPWQCFRSNGVRDFGAVRTYPSYHLHGGIDLGADTGTPIYALHAGTVHTAYEEGGAGTYSWIDHGDGTTSWYFHQSRRAAGEGERVAVGEVIGYVGETGDALQPHLHLETKVNGKRVDPVQFLLDRGVDIRC